LASVQSSSSPSCKWVPALFRVREGKAARERRWTPPLINMLAPGEVEVSEALFPYDHTGYVTPSPLLTFGG